MTIAIAIGMSAGRGGGAGVAPAYTYYVDPISGNDANAGTIGSPWLTTDTVNASGFSADTIVLTGVQSVGYKLAGVWYLYRKLNMTAAEAELAANLVTAAADQF